MPWAYIVAFIGGVLSLSMTMLTGLIAVAAGWNPIGNLGELFGPGLMAGIGYGINMFALYVSFAKIYDEMPVNEVKYAVKIGAALTLLYPLFALIGVWIASDIPPGPGWGFAIAIPTIAGLVFSSVMWAVYLYKALPRVRDGSADPLIPDNSANTFTQTNHPTIEQMPTPGPVLTFANAEINIPMQTLPPSTQSPPSSLRG
jgi:hypothetical protein